MYLKILLIVFAFCTGCATQLTQNDCEQINWTQKGERDGENGVYSDQFDKYQAQCMKYNITINPNAYKDGYLKGLKQYCTYSNGQNLGLSGESINQVCPNDQMLELEKGYSAGYEIYKAKKQMKAELERAQEDLQKEIKRSQEEALRAMNQCSFDSDCGQNMRCDSDYKSIGSVSGYVNICKAR